MARVGAGHVEKNTVDSIITFKLDRRNLMPKTLMTLAVRQKLDFQKKSTAREDIRLTVYQDGREKVRALYVTVYNGGGFVMRSTLNSLITFKENNFVNFSIPPHLSKSSRNMFSSASISNS